MTLPFGPGRSPVLENCPKQRLAVGKMMVKAANNPTPKKRTAAMEIVPYAYRLIIPLTLTVRTGRFRYGQDEKLS